MPGSGGPPWRRAPCLARTGRSARPAQPYRALLAPPIPVALSRGQWGNLSQTMESGRAQRGEVFSSRSHSEKGAAPRTETWVCATPGLCHGDSTVVLPRPPPDSCRDGVRTQKYQQVAEVGQGRGREPVVSWFLGKGGAGRLREGGRLDMLGMGECREHPTHTDGSQPGPGPPHLRTSAGRKRREATSWRRVWGSAEVWGRGESERGVRLAPPAPIRTPGDAHVSYLLPQTLLLTILIPHSQPQPALPPGYPICDASAIPPGTGVDSQVPAQPGRAQPRSTCP